MERELVWPNTAWLLGRSSPSDYILSRLAGVFFLLMFYLFTWVKLHDHSGSLKVSLGCLLGRYWDHPRNLARQEPWSEFLIEVFNYIRQMTSMNYMDHLHLTLQINNQLPTGTWLPMPTTGCTSWFWISSGQLGSWRPTRFSPQIWQESGKNIFQVFDASTFKTKVTMVTAQLIYTLITLVPVPFLFASYTVRLSTTFITMMHTH